MWFFAFAGQLVRQAGAGILRQSLRTVIRLAMSSFSNQGSMSGIRIPLSLGISTNLADTARWVDDRGKQVRYAAAVALTRTAKRLTTLMEDEVRAAFDKPTNFTIRAFGYKPANKVNLASVLFIKDRQGEYLRPNIVGGGRQRKRFEQRLADDTGAGGYWVPGTGVRLTAAGNLTLSQIKDIAGSLRKSGRYGEVFVGVPRGHSGAPFGIWARPKTTGRRVRGAIKPLLVKIAAPSYAPRFDFYGIAAKHAQRIFPEEFERAYAEALRTVRPISQVLIKL